MKQTYEDNPSLGDPDSTKNQLVENQRKLEKLEQDLKRFQALMDEVLSNTPTGAQKKGSISSTETPSVASSGQRHRNSLSDESLSRSASETSVNNNYNNGNTPTNSTTVAAGGSAANSATATPNTSILGGVISQFATSDSSHSLTSPNGGLLSRNLFTNGMLGAISKS